MIEVQRLEMLVESSANDCRHWKHKFEDLDREYQIITKKCYKWESEWNEMKIKYEAALDYERYKKMYERSEDKCLEL
jgi:hypothetical protein